MKIYFKNQSSKKIIMTLNGLSYCLPPKSSEIYSIFGSEVNLKLTTDEEYSYETLSEKRGMTAYHRFITEAKYEFLLEKDTQIILEVEASRGNNLDSYQRVIAIAEGFSLPEATYSVKNERDVKEKLSQNEKKLGDYDKKLYKFGKVLNVADKLDDIFTGICCVILALICIGAVIFGLITFTVPTIIILLVLGVVGVIVYKVLKRFVGFAGSSFEKLLDKHGDKLFPCPDMPSDLFKDDSSYFENEYISAVFKFSTKKKSS